MKKIIFVLSFASLGGIEKSLLNLLHNFDFSKYSVDIGVLNENGVLLKHIPNHAKTINIDCFNGENWNLINDPPKDNLNLFLRQKRLVSAIIYLFFYFLNKKTNNRYRLMYYKWFTRKTKKLPTYYDVAIAYEGPNEMIDYFIHHKINARKKICWIHFDVCKFGCPTMSKRLYKFYDKICVVSQEARKNFIKRFPIYEEKTITFYNQISPDDILEKANEKPVFTSDKSIKITTVGRITEEKGQTLAIESLKILIDKGYNVNWYFVGDGINRNNCENLAKKLGIYEHTFFEGNQLNPYVYMKNCDIYVQPSFHEGFCITLTEALCFDKPIISTDFTGAREQLEQRENAIITSPKPDLLANAIIKAIEFPPFESISMDKLSNGPNDFYNLLDL